MTAQLLGELVLRHLERFLGRFSARWHCDADTSLQVLLFPARPDADSQCVVTYGLSAHLLQTVGSGDSTTRAELIICANSSFDPKALAALLFAVGQHLVERHAIPRVHEVLMGSGAAFSNPVFQHFYFAFPGYFPSEFEMCETVRPPVAMIQLIPISSCEREMFEKRGWRVFEKDLVEQDIDLLAFDTRRELQQ